MTDLSSRLESLKAEHSPFPLWALLILIEKTKWNTEHKMLNTILLTDYLAPIEAPTVKTNPITSKAVSRWCIGDEYAYLGIDKVDIINTILLEVVPRMSETKTIYL